MGKKQLKQRVKIQLKEDFSAEESKIVRQSNTTYELLDGQFEITEYNPIQYASAYFIRLEALRPALIEKASSEWPKCNIQTEIVNVKPDLGECVIIGTLFKEMKNKPAIELDSVTILGKKTESYIDSEDTLIIEDQSGRVKLISSKLLNPANFVTGTIIAVKGVININGFFEASGWEYAGMPIISSMPSEYNELIKSADDNLQRTIFEDLESREFVAFVSGIEFGEKTPTSDSQRLAQWICGEAGQSKEKLLSSRISRIVIGGNNIGEESDIDEVVKGSFVTHDINEMVYKHLTDSIDHFESFITKVAGRCDVDIMPGENDISGAFFPQPKLNVALFPTLLKNDNIIFSTNPHMFKMNDLLFLGSSGQNIQDICCFKDMKGLKEVDILEETLNMRHLAPTCPDTLRTYPFESEDPLVIKETPNVYFSCNADEYDFKTIRQLNGVSKIFTVPSFKKTGTIVLLDLQTLDTYEYRMTVGKPSTD